VEHLLTAWEPGDGILLPRQLTRIISKALWIVSANSSERKILHLTSYVFIYLTRYKYSICLMVFAKKGVKFTMKT